MSSRQCNATTMNSGSSQPLRFGVTLIRERHGQHSALSVAAVKVDPVPLLPPYCLLARSGVVTTHAVLPYL